MFSEADWSDETNLLPYPKSKTRAEKAAWRCVPLTSAYQLCCFNSAVVLLCCAVLCCVLCCIALYRFMTELHTLHGQLESVYSKVKFADSKGADGKALPPVAADLKKEDTHLFELTVINPTYVRAAGPHFHIFTNQLI